MAKPPIQTDPQYLRADPFLGLIARILKATAVAVPCLFMLGAVLRLKGIL